MFTITVEEKEARVKALLDNSFLAPYLADEHVTDINFDGVKLLLKHNKKGTVPVKERPPLAQVENIFKQIADMQNMEFTVNRPILDTEIGFLRVNAVHAAASPEGMTFSLRVSRPRLAVTNIADSLISDNEQIRNDVAQLLGILVQSGVNIIISGATGTGKTELQKLLVGYMHDDEQIVLIEDTRDSHIKKLYPQKTIKSYQTLTASEREHKVTIQDLVKAGLRNFPDWLIVSETRGAEAADMLDAAKTNHSIITTLHATGAMNIPSRLMSMIRQSDAYSQMSDTLIGSEIVEFLPIGLQLELLEIEGKGVVRGIKEIVAFESFTSEGPQGTYLYNRANHYNQATDQYQVNEVTNVLPQRLLKRVEDSKLYHLLPDIFKKEGGSLHHVEKN